MDRPRWAISTLETPKVKHLAFEKYKRHDETGSSLKKRSYFSLSLSCLLKADTIPNGTHSADGTVICGQITEIAAS